MNCEHKFVIVESDDDLAIQITYICIYCGEKRAGYQWDQ